METLPPLDAVDETPLAQLAILKAQLQEDPDTFTGSQHSQLRQLAGTVREWVKDYQTVMEEPELSDFEQWELNRQQTRNNLPEELKHCKTLKVNQDTCTN